MNFRVLENVVETIKKPEEQGVRGLLLGCKGMSA